MNPYIKARAFLFRGDLFEAEDALSRLENIASSATERAEISLERARLHVFQGNWEEASATCTAAIQFNPVPLTLLALYQTRAHCRFELGLMAESVTDLRKVEDLHRLLPGSCSGYYARILESRIRARDLNPSKALEFLDRTILKIHSAGALSLDLFSAYLIAATDIHRLKEGGHRPYALANFWIHEHIGERLYSALALVDCIATSANFPDTASKIRSLFSSEIETFPRVRRLLNILDDPSEIPGSTSEVTLRQLQEALRTKTKPNNPDPFPVEILSTQSPSHIYCPRTHLLFALQPWKVTNLCNHEKLDAGIRTLASGSLSKTDFFQAVWRAQRYSARIHDPNIASLLRRLRGELGLHVRIVDGTIRSTKTLILE